MTEIAVVGIDCRFPAAGDKDAFWRLMMDGVVTDAEIPSQRWNVDNYYHPGGVVGSMNTRRAHFIDDVDAFDHEFFGIAPVEAAVLDPQQRLLLQTSWRAIEDAGIDPKSLAGTSTGVFTGVMSSEWSSRQMFEYPQLSPFHGSGSGYFMLANRISYHLGLMGPSMAIDSACSSSLVALHQGCAALRSGEADLVIVAGANLILTPALSVFYTQAGLSAPDGRCKPFCQGADGIGRGEGVAAVVLRRLDDAIAAGQQAYAVVKSSVANHDGRSNGITAPNRHAQAELMRRALRSAEIEAHQVSFVEGHGTGTVLGDMIETNALGDVHRSRDGELCLLGSVKGNIGHTEGAAGIASFVKACLALHHRVLPPTVVLGQANPGLRLASQGLRLADDAQELSVGGAVGAISSFGLGGSNAHVILGSAPAMAPPDGGNTGILTLSAPNGRALRRNAEIFANALRNLDDQQVASWCHATNVLKRSHRHRLVLGGNRGALVEGLVGYLAGARDELVASAPTRKGPPTVGLLCSGQGTQYPGMTRPLYEADPTYREQLESVCAELDRHLSGGMLSTILGDDSGLSDTRLTQPALFAVSYALGRTLLLSGVHPTFGIGHSVGEIAAACLAGVLTVADAARLAVIRGELMGSLPPGGAMIAVDLPALKAQALVAQESECAIAAVNAPHAVVISGPAESVATLAAKVRDIGGRARSLAVSHAFHSPLMRPIVSEFRRAISGLKPNQAAFPVFSTVLGGHIDGPDMDADYWASQICSPVRFYDAIDSATGAVRSSYIAEAGPTSTLLTLARQSGLGPQVRSLVLCAGLQSAGSEMLEVAAVLLRDGYSLDLSPSECGPARAVQRIPPYAFDVGSRFWYSGDTSAAVPSGNSLVTTVEDQAERRSEAPGDVADEVFALVAQIGGHTVGEINRDSRLNEDLGYDSLLQLRLLEQMRSRYPQLALRSIADLPSNIGNVGALVDLLLARIRSAEDTR